MIVGKNSAHTAPLTKLQFPAAKFSLLQNPCGYAGPFLSPVDCLSQPFRRPLSSTLKSWRHQTRPLHSIPHHITPPHINSRRSNTMDETFRLIAVLCLVLLNGWNAIFRAGQSCFSVIGVGDTDSSIKKPLPTSTVFLSPYSLLLTSLSSSLVIKPLSFITR